MSYVPAARRELRALLVRKSQIDEEIAKLENYIEVEGRLNATDNPDLAKVAEKAVEVVLKAEQPLSAQSIAERLAIEGIEISLPALYDALKTEKRLEGIRGKGFVIVH